MGVRAPHPGRAVSGRDVRRVLAGEASSGSRHLGCFSHTTAGFVEWGEPSLGGRGSRQEVPLKTCPPHPETVTSVLSAGSVSKALHLWPVMAGCGLSSHRRDICLPRVNPKAGVHASRVALVLPEVLMAFFVPGSIDEVLGDLLGDDSKCPFQ